MCCRIRSGIGIIRIKKAQGNSTALKNFHLRNRMMSPASRTSRDTREEKFSAPKTPRTSSNMLSTISGKPLHAWSGFPLIVLSMLLLVLGVLGAENFSSRVSLLVLLAGLIILFRRWKFFKAVLFPWAFLILMIPIPDLILQHITFPLQ